MRAQLAMFDFNWGELILIGIVALVAIGPKELPGALRIVGQWVAKARRMANEFQNQFHEAMREAELAEVKKEVDETASKAQSYAHFDAIDDIRKDLENAASPPHELVKPLSTTDLVEPLPTTPETAGSHSPSRSARSPNLPRRQRCRLRWGQRRPRPTQPRFPGRCNRPGQAERKSRSQRSAEGLLRSDAAG
jgi:sec-independent protein translocase protein TatB